MKSLSIQVSGIQLWEMQIKSLLKESFAFYNPVLCKLNFIEQKLTFNLRQPQA
jgi:hypothetical protein